MPGTALGGGGQLAARPAPRRLLRLALLGYDSPMRPVELPPVEDGLAAVRAEKRARREELREELAAIDPELAAVASRAATARLIAVPEMARAGRVLTCLSFGAELDTWPLVEALLESGREVFVPRADPRDRRLHVHRYPCPLRPLDFGLRQPPRGTPELSAAEIEALDLAIVLGLGFDRRGFRLGHGSGYFDRFLAAHPVFSIGLAFGCQLLDELPCEDHDLPMALVVTEDEVIRPVGG